MPPSRLIGFSSGCTRRFGEPTSSSSDVAAKHCSVAAKREAKAAVARTDDLLLAALKSLESKPSDDATRAEKKRYSENMSAAIALALADELRQRGCHDARPAPPGELGGSGAERRLAGGIGAKKVDVTWTTEESGLLLGISVKTINFIDKRSRNFQKNLTNRRSDMLIEAVHLHRRFPYAVLGGLLFLDAGAARDGTARRKSTFQNAHPRMQLFTGRNDPRAARSSTRGSTLFSSRRAALPPRQPRMRSARRRRR